MPANTDEFLAHYGVVGMKWGKRGSKKSTGVSRMGGALMDRNARSAQMLNDAKSGAKYTKRVAIGKAIIGEKQWEKNFQTSMSNMKAQNARIKSGKTSVIDKLDAYYSVSLLDLAVSRRPK